MPSSIIETLLNEEMPIPIGTSLHASSTTTGVHKFTVRSLKTSYTSCGMTRVLVGIIVVSFSKNNDEIALKWILEAGGSFTFTTPSPDSWYLRGNLIILHLKEDMPEYLEQN